VLVLQGPGVQRGQTEISVDEVSHQWLTNQIAEAPLHWRYEPTTFISRPPQRRFGLFHVIAL